MHIFSHHKINIPLLLFALLCFLPLTGCAARQEPVSATGFYYDTVITITLYRGGNEEVLDQCMELAAHYENLFSAHKEGSEIWQINHSDGAYVTISDDTYSLLSTALAYAELSNGLVDPSIGALSSLWNFGSDNQEIVPDGHQIQEALGHVDYTQVTINGNQVCLSDTASSLDPGFIAKGFIADRMKEFLLSKGVSSAIINLGGNVAAVGSRPDGTPFKIGIQKPFSPTGVPVLTLELSDTNIVSSGNYERYFVKDDILYHHILSPQTGYPAESGLSQVTILCENATDGDALSTLCFLLGYEKAAALLQKNFPDIQAIFITQDGEILYHNFPVTKIKK